MLSDKNILVTGGEGFIGSKLVNALSEKNNVRIFDIKSGKDIKDFDSLLEATKNADIVFHLASLISVEESMKNPSKYIENVFCGGSNVLRAAAENNVKRFVFSSSSSVYGEGLSKEESPISPKSTYALLKAVFERQTEFYKKLETVSLRFFNVYGPGQKMNSDYSAVIPIFITRAIEGKDLVIFGDGKQSRDFVYVEDVVGACCLAAEKGSGLFNVGSGKATSINELADMIIELTDSKSKKVYKEAKQGEIFSSMADISKSKRVLGFNPQYDIREGLERTIKWFKKNRLQ
jgi:UDP-glucose 4-epimerase